MKVVYEPAQAVLGPDGFDFCPGCGYGSVVLALAELAATLDQPPVFIIDIGCVDFMTAHLPGDVMMGPHGRATALATGYKRVNPAATVCAIQGDGAFMGIGATESLHTAARGEPITVIVLNNGVLADTGGQMAATTVAGHDHPGRAQRRVRRPAAVPGNDLRAAGGRLRRARRAGFRTAYPPGRQGAGGRGEHAAGRRRPVRGRGRQPVPDPLAPGSGPGLGPRP
jgi:hypothetical protein